MLGRLLTLKKRGVSGLREHARVRSSQRVRCVGTLSLPLQINPETFTLFSWWTEVLAFRVHIYNRIRVRLWESAFLGRTNSNTRSFRNYVCLCIDSSSARQMSLK